MKYWHLFVAAALVLGPASMGSAQQNDGDIRGLSVGMHVADMPADGYVHFACGSNGGPPLRPLDDWRDFALCPAEDNGLHEVYVEYDDETLHVTELYRQMYGEALWLEKYAGTRVAGYPVILSVLFDAEGVAQGLRAVTDSRAPLDQRVRAHALRMRIKPRYRGAEWNCVDLPLADGETPIGSRFIKEQCETTDPVGRRIIVRSHQFRKPGQTGYDEQGRYIEGDYESSTRWEIWDRSIAID